MKKKGSPDFMPRTALSTQRVLETAVTLADDIGIAALSMRKLGETLGVEAMALYRHVANKEDRKSVV